LISSIKSFGSCSQASSNGPICGITATACSCLSRLRSYSTQNSGVLHPHPGHPSQSGSPQWFFLSQSGITRRSSRPSAASAFVVNFTISGRHWSAELCRYAYKDSLLSFLSRIFHFLFLHPGSVFGMSCIACSADLRVLYLRHFIQPVSWPFQSMPIIQSSKRITISSSHSLRSLRQRYALRLSMALGEISFPTW
jgi:hypothetical protein